MTTHNRQLVLGEHPHPHCIEEFTLQLICEPDAAPHRLWVDLSSGLRALVPSKVDRRLPKPSIAYPFPYPYCTRAEPFVLSTATLNDVLKVRLCQVGSIVTGMLLIYANGAKASLGSVVLGQLGPSQSVTSGIWLYVSKSKHGHPRVVDVRLDYPRQKVESYFELKLNGEVAWWFSSRQCQICYDGRSTLQTSS